MSKEQTIFRIQKASGDFFLMHKGIVENTKLSLKAKGIMAYLLSKPDDWTVYLDDILKRSSDGKAAVQSGIKELVEAGHIHRVQMQDEEGKFKPVVWYVYEQPFTANRLSGSGKTVTGKTASGKSATTNNKGTNNKENNNDNRTLVEEWELAIGSLLTPTQMNLLYDLGLDWDAHTSSLPEGHPDKGRTGKEVLIEAIKITGINGVRKLSYTTAIVDAWMKEGFKVDTRKKNANKTTEGQKGNKGELYG